MNIKRLSKNIVFLYIRMLVLLLVMFYTSRVLLRELGVNDYGLYNVIGGVVLLFSSLKTIFSSAIQRFINYEKGHGALERIQEIFSVGVYIHLGVSILFLVLVEAAGLWYISNKLVVDPNRISAAYWVLHFSVLSSIVMIMTIPYDALIIANEKMNFFAYVSIIDGILRLLIVFCLFYFEFDKLKLYSVLVFLVSLIIRFINIGYCKRHFSECKLVKIKDRKLVHNMASFASWNFLGNLSYSISHEGINFLLNMFGGTVVNAARGIVYQVKNALSTILNNIVVAVNPQGIALYSEGNKDDFYRLLDIFTRIVSFIYLLMAFPLFFYTSSIVEFWLGMLPNYVDIFLKIILVYMLFRALHYPLDLVYKASGELKKYQLYESLLLFIPVILSYVVLKLNFSIVSVFWIMLTLEVVNYINILLLAGRTGLLNVVKYVKEVLSVVFCVGVIVLVESIILIRILGDVNFFLQIIVMMLVIGLTIYVFGFGKDEKNKMKSVLLRKIK